MKILHIISSYSPAFKYGGPIESVHLLNKALAEKRVTVDVFTTDAGIDKNNNVEINKWNLIDGVRVKYFKHFFYEHYTFSPLLLIECLKEIKNYDLVHITGVWNFPVLAGALACILNNKPFMISPRGVLYKDAINIKSRFTKLFYFNLIAKHYLERADAIHYTTENERDNVFKRINNNFIIIPNGIDLNLFRDLPPKGSFKNKYEILRNKKYILFLGRINKQKGINLLVEAFKNLPKEYKDLYLVIAGPDNCGYKKEVEKSLVKNNLLDKVIFPGMLLGKEKLSAYVDAEMFVLPSYFENFGMSVIEAMACNVPAIISNRVGICDYLKESNAGLIVNLESKELYGAIKTLLDNQKELLMISNNAKELVKRKYDINIVADKMFSEYKEIIGVK